MGGTFDPIHFGHLAAAEAVRQALGLEKVLFIPSGRPPHKTDREISPSEDRYQMTQLATASNPFFEASRLEIDRQGYTYTLDTIRQLSAMEPQVDFFFITGADAYAEILTWKEPEQLLSLCHFAVTTRPGYSLEETPAVEEFTQAHQDHIHFVAVPALDISSSQLRNWIREGRSPRYLLPESVAEYISTHELYKDSADLREKILSDIREHLSSDRFRHTLGVEESARKLAQQYGVSEEKASLAALLHDNAKFLPTPELVRLCTEGYPSSMELTAVYGPVLHAFAGAVRAQKLFPGLPAEILDAVRYHTTGRPNMNILEKIIFIADYIEPGRPDEKQFIEARRLAFRDLDDCLLYILRESLEYIRQKELPVYPLTQQAYQFYQSTRK